MTGREERDQALGLGFVLGVLLSSVGWLALIALWAVIR